MNERAAVSTTKKFIGDDCFHVTKERISPEIQFVMMIHASPPHESRSRQFANVAPRNCRCRSRNLTRPSSFQPVIFQLSHVSAKGKLGQEHSVWISDLTSDITEKQLERSFATRFDSLKAVKSECGFARFKLPRLILSCAILSVSCGRRQRKGLRIRPL